MTLLTPDQIAALQALDLEDKRLYAEAMAAQHEVTDTRMLAMHLSIEASERFRSAKLAAYPELFDAASRYGQIQQLLPELQYVRYWLNVEDRKASVGYVDKLLALIDPPQTGAPDAD